MTTSLPPPSVAPEELIAVLRSRGQAALDPAGLNTLIGGEPAALNALRASWNDLPPDASLSARGRGRRRRDTWCNVDVE